MRDITLFVAGMSCRRCVREVTARLRDVPEVETVTANSGESLVRLSGRMELADVLGAFSGTTYRPDVRSDVRSDARSDVLPHPGADSGGTAVGQSTS